MKPLIAIVNSSSFGNFFTEHLDELLSFAEVKRIKVDAQCDPTILQEQLLPFNGIIASVNPHYPDSVLESLPNLVGITRHGIGYNNIDIESATRNGIIVTKVAGPVERVAVAELAVSLLMSAARCIPDGQIAVRKGLWSDRAKYIGVEVTGKKVACIGLGNIGSRTAEILNKGFDAEILGYDPALTSSEISALGCVPTDIDEALCTADFVLLHAALTDDNYHLLDDKTISTLKDGVIVVNTARGELVDDRAMIKALRSGKVRCYATDVVEGEPIDESHPLTSEPNAIIVPHLGGYTYESLRGMGETMVENMKTIFLDKKVPENALNKSSISEVKAWQ